MQNRKSNLMGSITNLVRNFVELVETRLALMALDLQETGINFLSLLILCGVVLTCVGLALVLATLFVVVIFWDSHRLLALGGAAAFFALSGAGLWLVIVSRVRGMPGLFAATRGEFAKDREWLSRNNDRNVAEPY
jgi:uncharacterized membrane protein YqjE